MQARKRSGARAQPYQLSLHVRHPSVDPKEISRELGLEATEAFRAGEPRQSRSGLAATAVHGETYWVSVLDPMVSSAPAAGGSEVTKQFLATLLPQEAKMLRARFGLEEGDAMTPGSLGWRIILVCYRMAVRHGPFLASLREQGGSLTLLAAVEPEGLAGFSITPEMGHQLHALGLTVKIELANSPEFDPDLN